MDAPFKGTSCMAVDHEGGTRFFLDVDNGEHPLMLALHSTINTVGVSDEAWHTIPAVDLVLGVARRYCGDLLALFLAWWVRFLIGTPIQASDTLSVGSL